MRGFPLAALGLAVLVPLAACDLGQTARIATAHVSYTLCSDVFISGLDARRAYDESIRAVPLHDVLGFALGHDIDRDARAVRARLMGGFESRATYRDGAGCVTDKGMAESAVAVVATSAAASLPPIAGPTVVEPTDERVRIAIDRAFVEPKDKPARNTRAIVVLHRGRVVAERYAPGIGIDTKLLGYSEGKSVASALIGILVRQGRLDINAPAPIAAWRAADDPRGAITPEHLMRMTSGLAWDESVSGGGPDDAARMRYLIPDESGFALERKLANAPGKVWAYNSANTQILSRIIRDTVGGTADDVRRFAYGELFAPLGMRHALLEFDAAGTAVLTGTIHASARDWARFGQLYLADGMAGDKRILPAGWTAFSARPTPGAWVGYGAGFWTNRDDSFGAQRRRAWGMPADAFFASGLFGQNIVIVPSADLVVVRAGYARDSLDNIEAVSRLVGELAAALGMPRL